MLEIQAPLSSVRLSKGTFFVIDELLLMLLLPLPLLLLLLLLLLMLLSLLLVLACCSCCLYWDLICLISVFH